VEKGVFEQQPPGGKTGLKMGVSREESWQTGRRQGSSGKERHPVANLREGKIFGGPKATIKKVKGDSRGE